MLQMIRTPFVTGLQHVLQRAGQRGHQKTDLTLCVLQHVLQTVTTNMYVAYHARIAMCSTHACKHKKS